MQKSNKKGSILIWSIFLSLIISLTFVFVSTKVNQSIRLNSYLEGFLNKNTTIKNLIKLGGAGNLGDNEFLVSTENLYTLKNEENLIFSFSGNISFSGSIKLKSGGPIYYEITSFSGSNNLEYSLVNSGIISQINSGTLFIGYLGNDYDRSDLTVSNLGGLSSFLINSTQDYYGVSKTYKVLKNIGGKNIEKSIFEN
nr:hypothetical protein [Candidatus Gracilibacteria bacterium]